MTKPKTRKKYKFTCGHIGYGKLSWTSNSTEKRACAKCGARIESVIRKCVDCKKEFEGSKYGHAQIRCPECQGLFRLAASTARNRIRAEASRQRKAQKEALKKKLAPPKKPVVLKLVPDTPELNGNIREDCMFLDHCVNYDLKKDCNACVGCRHYVNKKNARFHGGVVR